MQKLRQDAGLIVVSGPQSDALARSATRMCVHCGGHWVVEPGSGALRGFCQNCNGYICGPGCMECVPVEKMLDIMEGTRNPTAVSVSGFRPN